jgi:hypothetical protein
LYKLKIFISELKREFGEQRVLTKEFETPGGGRNREYFIHWNVDSMEDVYTPIEGLEERINSFDLNF